MKIFLMALVLSPLLGLSQNDTAEIKNTMTAYQKALEKLDTTGTANLFAVDSKIYESGGAEGNYAHYAAHHLTPELSEFKSFTFTDYKISIDIGGNFAFVTEIYNYEIVSKEDKKKVSRKGIATSVLKKENEKWLIWISHNSSRK